MRATMYTKNDLMKGLSDIGVNPEGTLLVHSSLKSIGEMDGGANTVLDALIEYMKPGLLIFPTHTWQQINDEYNIFNPLTEPSCVGLLSNLFLQRPGVIRSWHPTHSVAALGKDAKNFTQGEEAWNTPCSRQGCWGKLYDKNAQILFLGCSLKSNTFLHGVEEWNKIPLRLSDHDQALKIATPDGRLLDCPQYRHFTPFIDVSEHYDKMEAPFLYTKIAKKGTIGDAQSFLCTATGMAELTGSFLNLNPNLFGDSLPVPEEWYQI